MSAVAVLAAASAAVVIEAPVQAASQTCQGRPATIVNTEPDVDVEGTSGDDVVVTVAEGNGDMRTYGGDDVLCIVPAAERPAHQAEFPAYVVDVGDGDDSHKM